MKYPPALAAAALAASLLIAAPVAHAGECSSYLRFSNPWITCIQEALNAIDPEEHLKCDTDHVEAVSPIDDKLYCAESPSNCRENPFQEGCPP